MKIQSIRRFFVLGCLLFGSLPLLSQTNLENGNGQKVRGIVLDAFTNGILPGATVLLKDGRNELIKGVSANEKGEFVFENIPFGRWTFEVRYIGYKSVLLSNVMVSAGKETNLRITMDEQIRTVKEVVITASVEKEKALSETALVSARMFSKEETERFAGSLGDPSRMVANYAGVQSANDKRNDIVIRVNSPSGLLWRLEGIEIANPNHFGSQGSTGGPVSMVNNNLLVNSDFFTGAFPAEYGNALSGVFDLYMRQGNRERFEGVGQVGFNEFEAGLEGPVWLGGNYEKGSFIANYRYSTLDLLYKMGMGFGTGTAIPHYQDFSFLGYIPTQNAG